MRFVYLFCWLLLPLTTWAQATFSAVWPFDGNPGGSASHPNVGTGGADFVGVAPSGVTAGSGYVAGQNGQAVNLINWSQTGGCNFGEYVQVTVQPLNGQRITLTGLTFYVNHSVSAMGNTGPQAVRVRSSLDGFSNDLAQQGVSSSFQQVSVGLGGSFANQTGPVTFRIYGCPPNGGGALRLDDLTINGSVTTAPLPVTLLYFTAKPDGDRVQLAWATTQEINAGQFRVEHSLDLAEYKTVGDIVAKGTTDERQYYGLTDLNPQPGINYYRLKQVDRDGSTQVFKPVAATIRASEPVMTVYPNPADADRIHLRLWNADDARVRLLTITGQSVGGQLQRTPGEADFRPVQPLPAGFYWLEITTNNQRRTLTVLVR